MLIIHLFLLAGRQIRIGRTCWLTHARLALRDYVRKYQAACRRLQAKVDLECTCSFTRCLSLRRTRHLHYLRVTIIYVLLIITLLLGFVRWVYVDLAREIGTHHCGGVLRVGLGHFRCVIDAANERRPPITNDIESVNRDGLVLPVPVVLCPSCAHMMRAHGHASLRRLFYLRCVCISLASLGQVQNAVRTADCTILLGQTIELVLARLGSARLQLHLRE